MSRRLHNNWLGFLFAIAMIAFTTTNVSAATADIVVATAGVEPAAAARIQSEIEHVSAVRYPEISARLKAPMRPLSITVADEIERSRGVMHLPPWAAGGARPDRGEIVLAIHKDGQRHDRQRVLDHELAHVAVYEAAAKTRVPRWLDEGIARVVAEEFGADDHRRLAEAKIAGRFIPLEGLTRAFPSPERDASLAYAQSGRAVTELISLGGDHGLATLLHRIGEGADPDDALFATYGLRTYQLQKAVERSVSWGAAMSAMVFDKDLVLSFFALFIALSSVAVYRRRRERFEAAFADEADPFDPLPRAFVLPLPSGPYCIPELCRALPGSPR